MGKNILKLILSLSIFTLSICFVHANINGWDPVEDKTFDFYYNKKYVEEPATTELQDKVDIGKEDSDNSIMTKLLDIFWFNTPAFYWDLKFIYYVKIILNIALWLLSFIALILVIYTFYAMFFSWDDKSFENAKKKLIGIFIALAIIWLAWLIVSFIFWRYQENWKSKQDEIWRKETALIHNESSNNDQIYLTI